MPAVQRNQGAAFPEGDLQVTAAFKLPALVPLRGQKTVSCCGRWGGWGGKTASESLWLE